ncbi:hypothetical protein Pth03_39100 [Planotetraspora thailandica]|uniref:Uncharacterized protein n=1 Tax=Planotetraspora thailandica TaxID=487172 RepID=A0A8J3XX67_9ACTN|nr:hypothetical protein Pth03_39100 [Planotetraspora thailandica]
MSKTYQNQRRRAQQAAQDVAVPSQVSVAMEQIAASMKDGLLALAVQSGLAVTFALLEEDVTALCGSRGRHNPGRTAVRHGSDAGSVVLGGRSRGRNLPKLTAWVRFPSPAPHTKAEITAPRCAALSGTDSGYDTGWHSAGTSASPLVTAASLAGDQ